MDVQVTPPQGRIEIITGCMFSGKTKELIHRVQRAKISDKHVVSFKPIIDDRYERDAICSHTGVNISSVPVKKNAQGVNRIIESIKSYEEDKTSGDLAQDEQIQFDNDRDGIDVIVFDEVNLFDSCVVNLVRNLAERDYRIILSGLDLDFRGEPFEPVPKLLSLSDDVEKRKAICEVCRKPANRTQRLIDGEPALYNSPTIDVGGEEKYEPRCRRCHEVQYQE